MAGRSRTNYRYNGIRLVKSPNNTWRAWATIDGRRVAPTFKTEGLAQGWVDTIQAQRARGQRPISATDAAALGEILEMLPDGVTLFDAVRFYLDAHPDHSAVPLADVVDAFEADKVKQGVASRTLAGQRSNVRRLLSELPDGVAIGEIQVADLRGVLDGLDIGPTTRNNYLRDWRVFWNWAVRHDFAAECLPERLTRAKTTTKVPEILTPQQGCDLLTAALSVCPEMVPVYALAMFAGVRMDEARKLDWSDIHEAIVHVPARVAKSRKARYADIPSNCKAILTCCRGEGPLMRLATRAFYYRHADVVQAAKLAPWPSNALRHSFGTYHIAAYEDAGRTALAMGHEGNPAMLFRHYRALAMRADGDAWFSIHLDGKTFKTARKSHT